MVAMGPVPITMTKAELTAALAASRLEADTWRAVATKDDGLLRTVIDGRGVEAEVKSAGLMVLAAEARLLLAQAINYVECYLRDSDGELVLTIQKREGKTPHEMRKAAEAQVVELQEKLRTQASEFEKAERIKRDHAAV